MRRQAVNANRLDVTPLTNGHTLVLLRIHPQQIKRQSKFYGTGRHKVTIKAVFKKIVESLVLGGIIIITFRVSKS
jgi:hypothetical protein